MQYFRLLKWALLAKFQFCPSFSFVHSCCSACRRASFANTTFANASNANVSVVTIQGAESGIFTRGSLAVEVLVADGDRLPSLSSLTCSSTLGQHPSDLCLEVMCFFQAVSSFPFFLMLNLSLKNGDQQPHLHLPLLSFVHSSMAPLCSQSLHSHLIPLDTVALILLPYSGPKLVD